MITFYITLAGIVFIYLFAMFAGVLTVYLHGGILYKSVLKEDSKPVYYHVINSNIPLQVMGWGKHARIIVSLKANMYFKQESFHGLLQHEVGHIINNYPIRRMIYLVIQWVLMYPLFSWLLGWWQSVLIYLLYQGFVMVFNTAFSIDKHKQEILADIYAGKQMKKEGLLAELIRGYMDIPNLRESDEHPSINERIKSIYEATKNE